MIVLDTHAWLWWCSDRVKLPASLVRRLAKKSELYVSAISVWEVCMYAYRQRPSHAQLNAQPRAAVRALCAADGIRMVPISDAIAAEAALISPAFHGDPADRFIVATALDLRAQLVTKDERITQAKLVPTTWS
jgi:PIN domain nuclease of toxin-antitoxin system